MTRTGLIAFAVLLGPVGADTVWIDHFNDLGSPGTDQTWFAPWPTWTSEGIPYFLGTTATFEGEGYHCGAACGTPADSSEYSFFGMFMSPPTEGVDLVVVSSGITFGSSSSYSGWFDFASGSVMASDYVEGVGSDVAGFAAYPLQHDTWYHYRLEQDLSEALPWIRVKIWEGAEPEPVHWIVEGSGLGFHPGEMILVHGFDTQATGTVRFDDVGVESQIAPRRVGSLGAEAFGPDLVLSWIPPPTADATSVYTGVDDAYFAPVPGTELTGIPGGAATIPGILGDPGTTFFFLVRGVNESGEGPPSNRVGEFEFELPIP